ncbi:Exoribonuclease R [Promicromonospora thailandica]|uniref:Exoribonuclease R n=1 Tax=Promicromonospora thailandica TaxID=765201 RepID=A0A9X2G7R0_9MICO|nr:Exoribonuclease R [Promicromonospora thailandica]
MFADVPTRQMRLAPSAPDDVTSALAALRAEVGLPAMFPQDVLEEARAAAAQDFTAGRADRRDIEFVTIDPPGSKDLDQAVHVEQSGEGYVVHYAIADVGSFVTPGGALDTEVRKRGMTVYGPDARTPLHPKILSEGAASLLPDEDRPAVLWTVTLSSRGIITGAGLERALVRSRERLTYAEVQSGLDAGTASESLQLLADVGRLRQSLEVARGGVSLEVPEQEVERREDGTYTLSFRRNLPVEEWNAQISLLTGIAAAHLMREAGVGLLRTLPEADPRDLARLHRTARALGIEWPDTLPYARLVPTLVSRIPEHAAFLNEATTLFRGAGYVAFGMPGPDGAVVPAPEDTRHAAIAADYAHVTAPLRRLIDRYATEICLAVSAGTPVPDWVLDAMPELPGIMAETGRRSASFERECIDIVEASMLADRLGEEFAGVVVDVEDDDKSGRERQRGQVVLRDPAVRARVTGTSLPLGDEVRVRLAEADVSERRVLFTLGDPPGGEPGPAASPEGGGRRTAGRRGPAPRRKAEPSPSPGPSPTPGSSGRASAGSGLVDRATPGASGPATSGPTTSDSAASGSGGSGSGGSGPGGSGPGGSNPVPSGRAVPGSSSAAPSAPPPAFGSAPARAPYRGPSPVPPSGSPTPFARPDDGPVPAHGALLSGAEPAGTREPAPQPPPASYPRSYPPARLSGGRPYPGRRAVHHGAAVADRTVADRTSGESFASRAGADSRGPQPYPGAADEAYTDQGYAHQPRPDEARADEAQTDRRYSSEPYASEPYPSQPYPSPRSRPEPYPSASPYSPEPPYSARPEPDEPYAARPAAQAEPYRSRPDTPAASGPEQAPQGAEGAPAASHPGHGVGYPPMRRPVRPQVRDEVPMSEPWPRRAPAARRLASMSQPVPVVRPDGYPGGAYLGEYPVLSSRELPLVVAADLLAVEGRIPDGYRY